MVGKIRLTYAANGKHISAMGNASVRFILCIIVIIGLQAGADALTTLIIIPTARTTGAHTYLESYAFEGVVLGTGVHRDLIKSKFGIGDNFEIGLNIDISPNTDTPFLWNAKQVVIGKSKGRTAMSVGFRALGNNSFWTPYLVTSTKVGTGDIHLGLGKGEFTTSYFAGADVLTGKWHFMGDVNNTSSSIGSVGVQYNFDKHWQIRTGNIWRANNAPSRVTVEFRFTNKY